MEALIFIALLFIVLIIGYSIFKAPEEKKYHENKREHQLSKKVRRKLQYLSDGKIRAKRIMNKEENQIYYTILKIFNDRYNVNTQVSFKAFLETESNKEAWKAYSDYYCDFLLTYRIGEDYHKPAAIIEYHGGGHYGSSAESKRRVMDNDFIKNEVLNKVGIKIFIIKEGDIKSDKRCIDNKKLEELLINIHSQMKTFKNQKTS